MAKEEFEDVSLFAEETPDRDKSLGGEDAEDSEASQDTEFVVPQKFQGKSMEDVIRSYENLEKEYGAKANEVGELRKWTDELVKRSLSETPKQETTVKESDVDFDDFVSDPKQAVSRVLDENERIKKLEAEITADKAERAKERITARHPDANVVVNSPDFIKWVTEKPGRARIFKEANETFDVDTAAEILDMYKATQHATTEQAKEMRDEKAKEDLKKAATEKGTAERSNAKPRYKRAELIRLKIEQPARYAAMHDDILKAYAEGRVI